MQEFVEASWGFKTFVCGYCVSKHKLFCKLSVLNINSNHGNGFSLFCRKRTCEACRWKRFISFPLVAIRTGFSDKLMWKRTILEWFVASYTLHGWAGNSWQGIIMLHKIISFQLNEEVPFNCWYIIININPTKIIFFKGWKSPFWITPPTRIALFVLFTTVLWGVLWG